jgi:NAD binding domain of 6-phosphogluconate dehydrogenase
VNAKGARMLEAPITGGLEALKKGQMSVFMAGEKDLAEEVLYFIEYSTHMSIVRTFILQFYLNALLMNKIGKCYLPSIVHRHYFSIIFNEKSAHYTQ